MSSYRESRRHPFNRESVGAQLRRLREEGGYPLWQVAPRARMDSTLLSRIETGERLPTDSQLMALAKFFRIPVAPLEAQCLAERMLKDYGDSPALSDAAALLNEGAGEYLVKKRRTAVNKRHFAVNNVKKKN